MAILDLLANKSGAEKAGIKATEVAKIDHTGKFTDTDYGIEVKVLSLQTMPGGVEVMAQAWKDGKQLGFGPDGTTDVERFRIFNPPILVDDANGTILKEGTDSEGVFISRKLKEDPIEAIRQTLVHTINAVGKENTRISPGSIGNTTSTYFPAAGENTPKNELTSRNVNDASAVSFASIRGGAGDNSEIISTHERCYTLFHSAAGNTYIQMKRGLFGFDTSDIGTDTISSATFSLYGETGTISQFTNDAVIDRMVPASSSAIDNADYNLANWAGVQQSDTRIALGDWSTSAYNDFALNATGVGNVGKTGLSWYGIRGSTDFDNSAPGDGSGTGGTVRCYWADNTGTTKDPKLVVVHAASAAANHWLTMGV